MNSDDNVMAQVLLAETMQGISTVSSSKSPDDYVVKYDGYYAINKELSAFLQEEKNQVCITSSLINYINAVQSIAICSQNTADRSDWTCERWHTSPCGTP